MSLSLSEVERIAALARLELSPEEKTRFREQLSDVLDAAERLQAVHTAGIPPTSSVLPLRTVLRDDQPRPGLPRERLLENAPSVELGQFRVPAVLAGGPERGSGPSAATAVEGNTLPPLAQRQPAPAGTAEPVLSLTESIRALRAGEVSSRELAQACLARIAALDGGLHAFLSLTPERALAQAGAADQRLAEARRSGDWAGLSPLLGVPIAVKDILAMEGVPCTCGSRILQDWRPPYTATAVRRLLEAGVVVVGKTNTDEFAMGSSTENSAYGPTRNPWNPDHVPGGSSGGSAAAAAARMVPAALGTDTGGSVRQPASYCGVSGIKSTYGRVSRYGLVAFASSLDSIGALAPSAADLAPLFRAMAGPDPWDATAQDQPVPDLDLAAEPDLRGLRIGLPEEYLIDGIQPDVRDAVRTAVGVLEGLGAEIRPIRLPHTGLALPVYYLLAPAEASANLARYDGVRFGPRLADDSLWQMFARTRGAGFGAEVKRRIMLGTYALSAGYYDAYYAQAQKVRTLIKRDFDLAFEQVDAIAAPVAPSTAFRFGEHSGDPLAMYLEDVFTLPANLAGVPGLAFPVGFDPAGLPIGMQLMGRPFGESDLFRAGHAYQLVTDWHKRAPGI